MHFYSAFLKLEACVPLGHYTIQTLGWHSTLYVYWSVDQYVNPLHYIFLW